MFKISKLKREKTEIQLENGQKTWNKYIIEHSIDTKWVHGKCSILLVNVVKITIWYHYTPIRMAKKK